ncbi:MAG: VCBS repeat-containing protein [Planctomycetaceae bacterium]|nr:VCBS repeat-containing protein [Planctomycetaceae bacterium]
MTQSQPESIARRPIGTQLLAILGICLLAYWIYTILPRDPGAEVEAIRERFAATREKHAPTGHSTYTLPKSNTSTTLDQHIKLLDPNAAGWTSEVVTKQIGKQLEIIKKHLQTGKPNDNSFAAITAEPFIGTVFPRSALLRVPIDEPFSIHRLPDNFDQFTTTDTLAKQLSLILNSSEKATVDRCSFKVTHIQLQSSGASAQIRFELIRKLPDSIEQLTFHCDSFWEQNANKLQLLALRLIDFEIAALATTDQTLFADVTTSVIDQTSAEISQAFATQSLRSMDHWCDRLSAIDDMSLYGHHGFAIGDVNQDGLEDLFLCDGGGLPNRLFVQMPDGTVKDISRKAGVDWLESTQSALLIDLDNDGAPDLVTATVAGLIVAANNGQGVFTIRAAIPNLPETQSLSSADYDNDGDLDLYLTTYGPGQSKQGERGFEAAAPIPYHDANNGGRNLLLQNQGDFQFTDVTQAVGLHTNNQRFSFAASWEDFDQDGDMDLYVANDFGRNNLYQNHAGKFRDIAAEVGVEDMAGGMSVDWGDANQDGRMDLYIGNMFSAAGNRITYQRQFVDRHSADSTAGIQRMARGNTLFTADSNGTFRDVSEMAGVTMGRWAWGSKFADLNNDGRQDLVVANGYISNQKADDL